jgi:Protein of unknown function (DUF2911)
MKKLPLLIAIVVLQGRLAFAYETPVSLPEPSPRASVSQTIGLTNVTVVYHRPSVLKRVVWGQLVPYGFNDLGFGTSKSAPWRAGANENTLVTFETDVTVAGKPLPAGTYGLSMAPAADGTVTLIFSHDTALWGSFFYDPSHDALRVPVKWEDSPFHELLTYDFTDVTKNSAVLALSWETKRIPIPISVDTDAVVLASLKNELHNQQGFRYQSWVAASNYLMTNNLELPLALTWADVAINDPFAGERNFGTYSNKADILEKMGRSTEASSVMDAALKIGNAIEIHQYGRAQMTAHHNERAAAVFKLNAQLHPDVWPVNYGLARAYSMAGDYPSALAALLKAQAEVPAGDAANAAAIKLNIEKLKKGQDIN